MENPSKEKEKMMPPLPPPRRQIRPPPPRNREAGRQNFLAIYRRIDETFQCCVDGEAHPDYSDLSEMVHESLLHGDAKAEALQSHSKRSRKPMSMRQHGKCGTFDLSKEFYKVGWTTSWMMNAIDNVVRFQAGC
ncbi:uncharacterized protein LOC103708918 isoform X1 [Phoenix dactylifera]|uniref:Uncharacterized protein LOC103708918 isoform X1 n=1 Tax=Phoenix dactylifera TaxID=42345 RepID=A0A8B9ANK3_PHODC|nr:uncharacterized protein LOC103708918 isoform X1 [Phoenix dactylifera]XP_038988337.1 uncharacterized protein LOC103708918 isoform X1 [Phoenix dactylifera]XP_038988338.1 uncharacterized protein LOC103708918 isoform X1 [Phoenix dactylifera]